MEYWNVHVSVLDSPEFVGADQIERGTWLCLQRFCIGQENSGLILDCAKWKDRQWQQVCRVTLREVRREARLFRWEGENLRVFYYPQEAEDTVKKKRLVAQENGKMGGRPPKNPHETHEKPTLVISEKAKGNEKKGNEITPPLPPPGRECGDANAMGDEELIRRWRALRETWQGPPVLDANEMKSFLRNRHVMIYWKTDDVWETIREFLNAPHVKGSAYIQWEIMRKAMDNSAGLQAQAQAWKRNQRPRFEVVPKQADGPAATAEDVAEMAEAFKPRRVNS